MKQISLTSAYYFKHSYSNRLKIAQSYTLYESAAKDVLTSCLALSTSLTTLQRNHTILFCRSYVTMKVQKQQELSSKAGYLNPNSIKTIYKFLWKGRPYSPLTQFKSEKAGRNIQGRITVRHRGGGHKRLFRIVEFRRYLGQTVTVQRVEYDPNRSAWIALVKPTNQLVSEEKNTDKLHVNLRKGSTSLLSTQGASPKRLLRGFSLNSKKKSHLLKSKKMISFSQTRDILSQKMQYWLATHDIKPGVVLTVDKNIDIRPGNTSQLSDLPIGTRIHHIELYPGQGAQLLRAAGVSGSLIHKHGGYAIVRLSSGKQITLSDQCLATIGQISNRDHNQRIIGKAGRSRWLGWRPTVRGVAMNPVDHPHGGGEGKTSGGRPSCSPWGKPTKGFRTKKKMK